MKELVKMRTASPLISSVKPRLSGEGNLWLLNNSKDTNGIATYSELMTKASSGNHFEITGSYSPNQCVKYSDLVVTTVTSPMTVSATCTSMAPSRGGNATIKITCTLPSNASWKANTLSYTHAPEGNGGYLTLSDVSAFKGSGSTTKNIYVSYKTGTGISNISVSLDINFSAEGYTPVSKNVIVWMDMM